MPAAGAAASSGLLTRGLGHNRGGAEPGLARTWRPLPLQKPGKGRGLGSPALLQGPTEEARGRRLCCEAAVSSPARGPWAQTRPREVQLEVRAGAGEPRVPGCPGEAELLSPRGWSHRGRGPCGM